MTDLSETAIGKPLLADALRKFPTLSRETKAGLLSRSIVRRLAHNEMWTQRTEPARGIALIISGGLRSVAATPEGKEFVFSIMRAGDVWGVVSTLDGLNNANDVYAHGQTVLLTLDRRGVHDLLDQQRDFRDWLMLLMCRRLRLANTVLEDRALQPFEVRLARLLISLRAPTGAERDRAKISQEMLAKFLGCSRPTIRKALEYLVARGLITLAYGQVEILDEPALAALLGADKGLYM